MDSKRGQNVPERQEYKSEGEKSPEKANFRVNMCLCPPTHTKQPKNKHQDVQKKFFRKRNCEPQHVVSKRGKTSTLLPVGFEPPKACYKRFNALYGGALYAGDE